MTSPAFAYKSVNPSARRFFWSREDTTAGTSRAAADAAWRLESFSDITYNLASDRYEGRETDGKSADLRAFIELTHHTEISWVMPYRTGGFAERTLAALMGTIADTGVAESNAANTPSTGINTLTMTPGAYGTICPTFSVVHDTGANTGGRGSDSLLTTQMTVSSVMLSGNAGGILMATINAMGLWPSDAYVTAAGSQNKGIVSAVPSAFGRISSKRIEGWRGNFHFRSDSNDGADSVLTTRVTSMDLTVARQVAPFYPADNNSQSPLTFDVGPISNTGNVSFRFDSAQTASAFRARLNDDELGSSTYPNYVKWTGSDSKGVQIGFYPMKLPDLGFNDGGLGRELTGSLTAYDDESVAGLTTIKYLKLIGDLSTVII